MVQALVTRSSCVFHRLKTIKVSWFLGNDDQMETVKFLLEKAVVLETMVLLTPKQGAMENTVPPLDHFMNNFCSCQKYQQMSCLYYMNMKKII